jgi:hypothetical protein
MVIVVVRIALGIALESTVPLAGPEDTAVVLLTVNAAARTRYESNTTALASPHSGLFH